MSSVETPINAPAQLERCRDVVLRLLMRTIPGPERTREFGDLSLLPLEHLLDVADAALAGDGKFDMDPLRQSLPSLTDYPEGAQPSGQRGVGRASSDSSSSPMTPNSTGGLKGGAPEGPGGPGGMGPMGAGPGSNFGRPGYGGPGGPGQFGGPGPIGMQRYMPGMGPSPHAPPHLMDEMGGGLPHVKCRHCGRVGHMMKYCPRIVCFQCHATGHMSSVCPMLPGGMMGPGMGMGPGIGMGMGPMGGGMGGHGPMMGPGPMGGPMGGYQGQANGYGGPNGNYGPGGQGGYQQQVPAGFSGPLQSQAGYPGSRENSPPPVMAQQAPGQGMGQGQGYRM